MSRRAFGRAQPKRNFGRKVLIACEGIKTEPNYFDEIRRVRRRHAVQVDILPHCGTDPKNIVHAVAQKVKEVKKEKRWDEKLGDTAWAVFDGDEHMQENWVN